MPTVVSYGGGVNSTALLVGMCERGIKPDLVLFADTGGEHDSTYKYVDMFSSWLHANGMPPIQCVRYNSKHGTLEQECLNNQTIPSKAFGYSGCSVKWKRQPMDQFVQNWQPAIDAWARGEKVVRAIGIDAGEKHRGQIPETDRYTYTRPLVDWEWGRDECLAAIDRAGLPSPGKSACWFCPAARPSEVIQLSIERRDLYDRAVAMEQNARNAGNLQTVKGLGRNWSWENVVKADAAQMKLFGGEPEIACMCFDGEE